mmetsp:Transcript_49706/g.55488  ORF Transcript_49706/g.55488 Transcript_49706/m.55488 type:complete len:83 (-) Transcript_49706:102-350(-)
MNLESEAMNERKRESLLTTTSNHHLSPIGEQSWSGLSLSFSQHHNHYTATTKTEIKFILWVDANMILRYVAIGMVDAKTNTK